MLADFGFTSVFVVCCPLPHLGDQLHVSQAFGSRSGAAGVADQRMEMRKPDCGSLWAGGVQVDEPEVIKIFERLSEPGFCVVARSAPWKAGGSLTCGFWTGGATGLGLRTAAASTVVRLLMVRRGDDHLVGVSFAIGLVRSATTRLTVT